MLRCWSTTPHWLARLKPALSAIAWSVVPRAFDDAIEEQVEALAQPDVELPGGSRLHIHPTPALVAIDVDAGGAVGRRGTGKTAAHLAANRRCCRCWRGRSGCATFPARSWWISPACRPAGAPRSAPALAAALAEDPLHPRLLGFTALGLAEIVRPRVHPPLHELLAGPHAAGLAALRCIAAEFASAPHRMPALRASPAVVAALQADAEALADLARRAGRALILHADARLHATEWVIENSDVRG